MGEKERLPTIPITVSLAEGRPLHDVPPSGLQSDSEGTRF
jgi:hypothetical protein